MRDPVFTQRSFFPETGVAMLSEAAAISNSITSSSLYAPWSEVESGLLNIVVIFALQDREKRKWLGVQLSCRASLRFHFPLPVAENALWSMIPVLLLPWHLNVTKEKHGKVGEIEKLRQSFKEECHDCYCLFGR